MSQIWFQNRRQMTRRRSQPPSSFALDSSQYLSQESLSSSGYSSFSLSTYGQSDPFSSQTSLHKSQPDCPQSDVNLLVEESEGPRPSAAAVGKPLDEGTSETMSEPQRDLLPHAATLAAPAHGTTGKAFPNSPTPWTWLILIVS